jgi:hypothetical protein
METKTSNSVIWTSRLGTQYEVFTPCSKAENYTCIEVIRANGDWAAEIGCWFESGSLVDYDGVYCLSMNAIKALRSAGWSVPRDIERDARESEAYNKARREGKAN